MRLTPKRSLGQNFLINKDIIKKIIDFGDIKNDSTVIEIGPGTGNLTDEILKRKPKNFIAIEKDKELYLKLKNKYNSNIDLINSDVLDINWNNFKLDQTIVFGNLPYNISSKILINWIRLNNLEKLFKKFILMFQKEVADRIIAEVNSSKYGRLSILAQWKMLVKKLIDIDSENFFPKPKVKSSLLFLKPRKNYLALNNILYLEKVTDIFFQNRRKMIRKPLNILFKDSAKIVNKYKLDQKNRPQNIDIDTFIKISKDYEYELCLE